MDDSLLLDTNILIFWTAGGRAAQHLESEYGIESNRFRPFISTVSIGEAAAVMEAKDFGKRRKLALPQIISNVTLVDVHLPEVVDAFVNLYLHLKSHAKGDATSIGDNDIWIAASALATDSRLITSDKLLHKFLHTRIPIAMVDSIFINKLIKG